MSLLDYQAFQPLYTSSHASFNSSALGATSHSYALQATGTREWSLPQARSIRLLASTADRYHVKLGSTASVSAGSSDSMLMLGNVAQVISIGPSVSHIAFVSSTTITVNVTLGIGR